MVHDQVDRGAGDEGRELFQELAGLEEELRGAIAPERLERDEDASRIDNISPLGLQAWTNAGLPIETRSDISPLGQEMYKALLGGS